MNVLVNFFLNTILFSSISSACLWNALNRVDYIEGLSMRISVNTTSDWTQIEFANISAWVIDESVAKFTPQIRVSGFHIMKPSYDSTEVEVRYDVLIKELPAKENILFYIKKGDIGKTTITFLNESQIIGQFENNLNIEGDPANKKTFRIHREFFKDYETIRKQITYPEVPKLVLAFYYPWYGKKGCSHKRRAIWDPSQHYSSVHTPILGYYDSADTTIIRKHIEFAKDAGIDGFIISWWGKGTSSDTVTAKIFKIAEKMNFKVTIYHEQANKPEDVVSDIKYILRKYRTSPSFLKIQEKPVIFYYGRVVNKFTPKEWKDIFSQMEEDKFHTFNIGETMSIRILFVFDGFHIYNNMNFELLTLLNQELIGTAHIQGKIFGATVIPGYNDTLINKPGTVVERNDGKYYSQYWESALNSNPDIILITSFNEWREGTEIEPSKEYGMKYLDITKKYGLIFKEDH